ncbi:MAG: FMN-binding negative transcriptional regulator [Alphaproteobacteria bacterium]
MYLPAHFTESDPAARFALIEAYPFASLIVPSRDGLDVTHLPLLLDRPGGDGMPVLLGHVARANPIWQGLEAGSAALAIFRGPEHYVSPDWYENTVAVPTWNYAVVHAHGRARLMAPDELEPLLVRLSAVHEARLLPKPPWTLDKLPRTMIDGLKKAIVGFAISVERIDGKFKLSQNRSRADQDGVVAALDALDTDAADALAASMRAGMERRKA